MVRRQCVVERWWAIKGEIGDLIIVGRILTRNGAGFLSHSLFIRLISAGTLKGWCAVRTLQEAVQDFHRSRYSLP